MALSDPWYKNAVIYALDVETFADGNGDGIGDFEGALAHIEHLVGVGVNCLYVQPFYPSPRRDAGYDVADYYAVDERFGTLGDFVTFLRAAQERGMRILIDLVINHTSTDHPWFQHARSDPDDPHRDWYIWTDDPDPKAATPIFPGMQGGVWAWDEAAQAYYLHRFYAHEPDLNLANRQVQEEVGRIMTFWLQLGVDGFRVDAAPYVAEKVGGGNVREGHWFLREMRDLVSARTDDGVLLAETDVDPDEYADFFDDGRELHLLFNFYANQYLFLALADRRAAPLATAVRRLPAPPATGSYVNWVRNHDELDLGRLGEDERARVLNAFAPEEEMQIWGRGARRRLAPMLDGEPTRVRLAYAALFSLPGVPMIRYGDEIGMGDDLSLPERLPVRTPMQWSDDRNAGFSSASPGDLVRPVIDSGSFCYELVNVADQLRDPHSLLSWMQRLVHVRRRLHCIGSGTWHPLDIDERVLVNTYSRGTELVLTVVNFSEETVDLRIELDAEVCHVDEVFRDHDYGEAKRVDEVQVGPFGYRWFSCRTEGGPDVNLHPVRQH